MVDVLTKVGIGIVVFTIVIGVGVVVLYEFGDSVGGTANATVTTLSGYLSTNLSGWVPAIIAFVVGLLFIGALMGKRKY